MPLPPFHLVPGAALKLVSGRYFSLTVFTFSQIIMDTEPLIRILSNSEKFHGFTNTLFGASLVGVLSIWPGKFICEFCHKVWNTSLIKEGSWLKLSPDIPLKAAVYGSISGVYIHFILDAIMYSDIHPWEPFSHSNPFLWIMSPERLHQGLLSIGIFSLLGLIFFWFRKKTSN